MKWFDEYSADIEDEELEAFLGSLSVTKHSLEGIVDFLFDYNACIQAWDVFFDRFFQIADDKTKNLTMSLAYRCLDEAVVDRYLAIYLEEEEVDRIKQREDRKDAD